MLSNVINAGKNIANKIGNTFLNLSEIEAKIKEATNDDQWGPQGFLMKEISDETFSSLNFNEVMTYLWFRMFTEKPTNKRRTYKAVVLLSYMLINGSEYVSIRCRDHIGDLQRLEIYSDSNGIPDSAIRTKARYVCELLLNAEKLQSERDRARQNKLNIYGSNTSASTNSQINVRPQSIEQSMGDFDSWNPKSKSIPFVIGETFVNFVETFTQNISGPPPTEIHDNFELQTNYEIEVDLPRKKDTQLSSNVKDTCSRSDRQITNKIDTKKIEIFVPSVDNEVPIIDFSDPTPVAEARSSDFRMEFSNGELSARGPDDDFGDFRAWDHQTNVSSHTTYQPRTEDFFPDFGSLSHHVAAQDRQPSAQSDKVPGPLKEDKSKSVAKVGSTWTDIGSLNIDLDNVCGSRRPMFSTKS